MRKNQLNKIRAVKVNKLQDGVIEMTSNDIINSKILVNDSELLRIIKHLQPPTEEKDYPYIPGLISLKVNKSINKYRQVRDNDGCLTIGEQEWKNVGTEEETKWELSTEKNTKIKRLLTASGHTRSKKSLFIEEKLQEKVDDILMCGLPKDTQYDKLSKWNSYYGLVSTDSKVVSMPNIVVIDDFKNPVTDKFDVVKQTTNKNGEKSYSVESNVVKDIDILPFDGAGLVSVEQAEQWRIDLEIDYIPAAFQFRAIPCAKGNLYTFDIKRFADTFGVDEIVDVKGIHHSFKEEKIDCILTLSQFKFAGLFSTIEEWKEKFSTPCHGYERTFNISEYSEKYDELKHNMLTAYQPMQTINFSDTEIENVSKKTIEKIEKISTNVDEFLKFRGLVEDEENKVDWSIIPPYYKALKQNKSLFNDKYVQDKIKVDIQNIKNRALTGKLYVKGNYQVLTPDIFGLAQSAFGLKVTGLLFKNQVYSNYWNNQKINGKNVREVDIVRNPHIAMEHRIATVTWSDEMVKWYKYQDTGIITSMYDTILLALNGADTDGDHIATIADSDIIAAVKREIEAGNANTIDFYVDDPDVMKTKGNTKDIRVNDIKALMDVDILGMSNDIGTVIDRVSELWSLEKTTDVYNYIKVMSIIASLTIDYAKTGEKAEIPKNIKATLKSVKKPYFMKYLPSQQSNKAKEEKGIKTAIEFKMDAETVEKQKLFSDKMCNVNRICWYLEKEIENIELKTPEEKFDFTCLLNGNVDSYGELYKSIKARLTELHTIYAGYTRAYKMESINNNDEKKEAMSHYRYFYEYCRNELLSLCKLKEKRISKVLDILVHLYYADKLFIEKDKSILWNAFGEELVIRCTEDEDNFKEVEIETLIKRRTRTETKVKETRRKIEKGNVVNIDNFNSESYEFKITDNDRSEIVSSIKEKQLIGEKEVKVKDVIGLRRLFLVLVIITRYQNKCNIKINDGGKNTINYSNLAKLADIDRRYVKELIAELIQLKLIEVGGSHQSNPVIKVKFGLHEGKVLYSGKDIVEASKLVKSFRVKTKKSA